MPLFQMIFLNVVIACQPHPAPPPPLSMKAEHLLQILMNPKIEEKDRIRATREIVKRDLEQAILEFVFSRLPGNDEAAATKVIGVLRHFDDRKVHPRLGGLQKNFPKVFSEKFQFFLVDELAYIHRKEILRVLEEEVRRFEKGALKKKAH